MEGRAMVGTALDTLILLGILLTAVISIFKAGRWFGGIVDSVNHLSRSMDSFKSAFDNHTAEEDQRFISVESQLKKHCKAIEDLRSEVANYTAAVGES